MKLKYESVFKFIWKLIAAIKRKVLRHDLFIASTKSGIFIKRLRDGDGPFAAYLIQLFLRKSQMLRNFLFSSVLKIFGTKCLLQSRGQENSEQ